MSTLKRIKIECPYIDKIQRHILDFDLIFQCNICLTTTSIYCCLICGKFLEGIGSNSHAYMHSLEKEHNLFINADTEEIICLPENYHVYDDTLEDIKYNLKPSYSENTLNTLKNQIIINRSIEGQAYIAGLIPLNDLKSSSYVNVIIYTLSSISLIRDKLLLNNYTGITQALGQIYKKM